MFLPPVSSSAYLPPARAAGPREVGAAVAVEAVLRRETRPEPDLGAEEQHRLEQLRNRDRELRQQERAQVLLGGTLVRTLPNYTYERGPDGDFYAVDGVETVDTSGRGMLDPALSRRPEQAAPAQRTAAPSPPAAAEAIVATSPQPAAQDSASTQRIADDFAAAAARFYLASANAAPRRPIVDLYA